MKKFFLFIIVTALAIFTNAQGGELIIKKDEKGLYLEHIVAPKEGLYAIGRLYNVNPKFIAAYNKMDINQAIDIDQVLRIPLTDTNFTQKRVSGTPVYYEIGAGDGLLKVSNENNKVTLKNLRDWNALASDNLQAGTKLVVGFLNSKEMTAQRANNLVNRSAPVTKQVIENKAPENKPAENKPVTSNEPIATSNKPTTTAKPEPAMEKKAENPTQAVAAVVKEEVRPGSAVSSYFKTSFDQQTKANPPGKNATVTAGIFKTTSGWQDAKYYLLIDGVSPGTIIKVINPDNNKAVYAKVLGEMNGIRQNQGLDIRISNAAAAALQIPDEDKFVVKVNY